MNSLGSYPKQCGPTDPVMQGGVSTTWSALGISLLQVSQELHVVGVVSPESSSLVLICCSSYALGFKICRCCL